jgi:hypothetical protein
VTSRLGTGISKSFFYSIVSKEMDILALLADASMEMQVTNFIIKLFSCNCPCHGIRTVERTFVPTKKEKKNIFFIFTLPCGFAHQSRVTNYYIPTDDENRGGRGINVKI